MIHEQLLRGIPEPKTVRAAVIGCGDFGGTIVTQAACVPRVEIRLAADIDVEAGRRAYRLAGVADEDIAVCDTRADALRAYEQGKHVVVQDGMLLMDMPVDVVCSATRSPEAGARFAKAAIENGKHVVMVDKEADSVAGPILKYLADRAGVVYTTDDGDEPGLLMGLAGWARTLGLEVLSGGQLHSCVWDPETGAVRRGDKTVAVPERDRWALERIPDGETARYCARRRELFAAFREDEERGDPMCHLAVEANGTGLLPDTPTGHRPVARFQELPDVLCPRAEGGILERRGVIDDPTILRTADQVHGGKGVFIVVANADAHSRAVMIEKGLYANRRGTAMLIYRPFGLRGAETAMSILCAGLLRVPTGATEIVQRVDIAGRATRAYRAGETIASSGTLGWDPGFRAFLRPATPLAPGEPLPFFMLEGNRLAVDVPAGSVITREMVAATEDSVLWNLRAEQDARFFARRNS